MFDLNSCYFVGNVVRDPETRAVGSSSVTSFSVAVNNSWKNKKGDWEKETAFVDLEVWGDSASDVKKGDRVFVEARVKQDTWTDKQSGQQRSKLKFRVNKLMVASKGGPQPAAQKTRNPRKSQEVTVPPAEDDENEDDQIPF
jgi:single-strand DNA-binding protein